MKYFTIEEMEHSDTAKKNGIDNTSNGETRTNLIHLIEDCLDPIRDSWGNPINVTSGYRCSRLNKMIGGATNSQHQLGEAADIVVKNNQDLFEMILDKGFLFDQLILEPGWIHISYKWREISKNRKQVLTAKRNSKGKMVYYPYKREK